MKPKQDIKRITIVGAGNVAHNLALSFKQAGYLINEVYSRTMPSARLLGQSLGCPYITQLGDLNENTDLLVLAINDDALPTVIEQLQIKHIPIIHTSGSTPLSIFEDHGFEQYGIFYPVQTLSKKAVESLSLIPICVEGSTTLAENLLLSLARSVSSKVYVMDSEKRKTLHVAAVFANNFSNHLFHIADEILQEKDISFEVIRPLLEKTMRRIKTEAALNPQTGPAVRNDREVIDSHLLYLDQNKEYQEIYRMLTESIVNKQKNK